MYIEPYPKSRAPELHDDSIYISGEDHDEDWTPGKRIPFEAFLGIGPRRFFDLFSLKLSTGYTIERKSNGAKVEWNLREHSRLRVPMPPASYIEREQLASTTLNALQKEENVKRTRGQENAESQRREGVLDTAGTNGQSSRKLAGLEERKPVARARNK